MSTVPFASWRSARPWRLLCLLAMTWMLLTPARAGLVVPVAYSGSGIGLFDASTGSGAWTGTIDEVPDPLIPSPLSLLSVVSFNVDATTGLLGGSFEFTDSLDFDSTLFGTLTGRSFDTDPLVLGGQFEIDYTIMGGSGRFAGFGGFGLAFLDLVPASTGFDYRESGLLVLQVPAPGTLGLAGAALLLLHLKVRRRQSVLSAR